MKRHHQLFHISSLHPIVTSHTFFLKPPSPPPTVHLRLSWSLSLTLVIIYPSSFPIMYSSLNFVLTSPPNFTTSSFRNSTTLLTNKRRRHASPSARLRSPGPKSQSPSVPQPSRRNPTASIPNPSSRPDTSNTPATTPDLTSPSLSQSESNPVSSHDSAPSASQQTDEDPQLQQPPNPISQVTLPLGPLSFPVPARWLLYSVPFFWGSFGPSVRLLFAQQPHQDPAVFNTERLLLSTLVYVPVLFAELQAFVTSRNKQTPSQQTDTPFAFFPAGVELGVYVFLANVAQVIGLQQTSASRAAFLVQLQTVIVPVLSGIFGIDKISPKTWISSFIAVAGVALLSSDKGHGTISSLGGDFLEILSALFFSTYIIRLSNFCNRLPANPLVATKIATQAVLSIGWAFLAELANLFSHAPTQVSATSATTPWTISTVAINLGVVAWTGLMTSAVSGWAQTRGQQGVPASEAVVIFATQPLWASALAAIVLGESFGPRGFAGGALIVAATLIASKSSGEREKET